MDSADPQLNRFLQQLQAETQRQKFTEQVHTLTGRCWDVCFADYRPPSKMDGKTQTCIQVKIWENLAIFCNFMGKLKKKFKKSNFFPFQNCVNRMIDASNFMVEHLSKMNGGHV